MPVIYSLVSRGKVILAEYSTTSGNFVTVSRRILEKLPSQNSKMSYTYDRHIFHYILEDGMVFLCMADEEMGRRIPFAFLGDIKSRFSSTYGEAGKNAPAYGMNEDFARVLRTQMEYYSNNPEADRMSKLKSDIDGVKSTMVTNIEKVLERGERIELLVDKAESLENRAVHFKKNASVLKRSLWWKNVKLMVVIAIVLLLLLYVCVAIACGGPLFGNCLS